MKSFDKYSEDFENKILEGEFDKLSAEELKQLEAEGITKDELSEIKAVLLALNEIENEEIKPSNSLRDELLNAFEEDKSKRGIIISWPFLLSTVASIAALLIFVFYLYNPFDRNMEMKPVVVQQMEIKTEIKNQNPSPIISEEELISEVDEIDNTEIQEHNIISPSVLKDSPPPAVAEDADLSPREKRMVESQIHAEENISEDIIMGNSISPQANSMSSKMESISLSSVKEEAKKGKSKDPIKTSMSLSQLPNTINNLITIY
jgi:hypothetical protein